MELSTVSLCSLEDVYHSREEVDDIKLVVGQGRRLVGLEFLQELPLLAADNEPVGYVPVLQVGQRDVKAKVTIILHTHTHTHTDFQYSR